jgi:hypothetical protein
VWQLIGVACGPSRSGLTRGPLGLRSLLDVAGLLGQILGLRALLSRRSAPRFIAGEAPDAARCATTQSKGTQTPNLTTKRGNIREQPALRWFPLRAGGTLERMRTRLPRPPPERAWIQAGSPFGRRVRYLKHRAFAVCGADQAASWSTSSGPRSPLRGGGRRGKGFGTGTFSVKQQCPRKCVLQLSNRPVRF